MVALKKIPAVFYRTAQGAEPVRDFLLALPREDRRIVGADIATVEYGWPVGKPTCAPLGLGLWEVRSTLATNRIARVIFTLHDSQMVLLHAFIKKTQKTPPGDLEIARKRMKEAKQW
ncbi:MAG TPA: type II toxin-antitoxin system RelE/ParE family toxin [Chloroflexota bacterium]|nr:type II toxin-antitoxin system RelE/ParE family toxin [Chloroflexota bacterium]